MVRLRPSQGQGEVGLDGELSAQQMALKVTSAEEASGR
jgi:hypothetical protein